MKVLSALSLGVYLDEINSRYEIKMDVAHETAYFLFQVSGYMLINQQLDYCVGATC